MNKLWKFWAAVLITCTVLIVWHGIGKIRNECFQDPKIFEDYGIKFNIFSDLESEIGNINPESLARCRFETGDFRMMALDGIVPEIPGVPDEFRQDFKRRYIVATGDKLDTEAHASWVAKARAYAMKFNKEMFRLCRP